MAPLCKFYQQGTCRNGSNCRFEHPGANSNPFGSANNNRYGALSSGGGSSGGAFGRGSSSADGSNAYKITKDAIKIDLQDERPSWVLSSYGPGRDAPEQLFGGYPREQSFEEIRLSVLSSPNPQQALQDVQTMCVEAEKQMDTALRNLDGAIQFVLSAENNHPNRHDICKQNTQGGSGVFAVGSGGTGFGANPLSVGSSANQNPFGATQSSPFGAPAAAAPTTSAFGQPSQMGAKPNPFGAPASTGGSAFGQPSSLGAGSGSAFGQPSALGQGSASAFGQPSALGGAGSGSAFGQPSSLGGGSAFGQPSSLGAKSNPFAAPANASSGFAAAAQQQTGAFGQPSALGAKPNPFGTPASTSAFGAPAAPTTSAFGQPSQMGAKPTPFGAPSQPSTSGPFGAPSQPASSSPFGAPSQPSNPSPFGASSQPSRNSPFGTSSQPQNASPFGAPAQPSGAPATSPFGQPSAQATAFGTPTPSSPFSSTNNALASQAMETQAAPAASNPFGQPATNGFGAPSNSLASGVGGLGGQSAASAAPQGANSPYQPGSMKQHPPLDSYVAKMGTRIIRFKNMPVSYKNDKPGVQTRSGWTKIWFPNGPPTYYSLTEPEDKSAYTDAVHKVYEESSRTGRFPDLMPEVPPMREDCVWDF
ncbi:hypothetical protein BKA67DRAFT_287975 [Truncatella angustata]|uniref:C3H1-type domain-containing protein n=1 Tax=Truncatella angustata TaxID=152316 RepID=A0A9P8UM61_9PEZI|nr:uncharacterized protein BKA67DRAFT_287975 [Truncatella angustata]KAH6654718.1 hypothetical protein BKA67DRAFT_287975 [Truncatella angustata]